LAYGWSDKNKLKDNLLKYLDNPKDPTVIHGHKLSEKARIAKENYWANRGSNFRAYQIDDEEGTPLYAFDNLHCEYPGIVQKSDGKYTIPTTPANVTTSNMAKASKLTCIKCDIGSEASKIKWYASARWKFKLDESCNKNNREEFVFRHPDIVASVRIPKSQGSMRKIED